MSQEKGKHPDYTMRDKTEEREKTENSPNRKRLGKKKLIYLAILVAGFLAYEFSFAWYRFSSDEHAETDSIEIMTPYFLYLMNSDDQTSLQFSVGNLHPGEVKQIVICVSNKRPVDVTDSSIDIARVSEFAYDLEFVYTENLAVNYDIYELDKSSYVDEAEIPEGGILVEDVNGFFWTKKKYADVTDPDNPTDITKKLVPDKDVTETRLESVFGVSESGYDHIFNHGRYMLYQKDGNGEALGLKYDVDYEYDYYLIEITWKDGVNFSEYTKETDLLYVIVNAKQPKPLESE